MWDLIEKAAVHVKKFLRKLMPKMPVGRDKRNASAKSLDSRMPGVRVGEVHESIAKQQISREIIAKSISTNSPTLTAGILGSRAPSYESSTRESPERYFDRDLIRRCQGNAEYVADTQTLPCLLYIYYAKWAKLFPLLAQKKGRRTIEDIIVFQLEHNHPGCYSNLWREIERELSVAEDYLQNPPSEADKEMARAYARRLGHELEI